MGEPGGTPDVIGRAGELQAVDRFLEQASHGLASLVIEGEAGIGKTSLWRASLERATGSGARVLRSAPAKSEQSLTLGGLTDVLSEVGTADLSRSPMSSDTPWRSRSCVPRRRASCPISERCRWRRRVSSGALLRSRQSYSRSTTRSGSTTVRHRSSPTRSVASPTGPLASSSPCAARRPRGRSS